VRTRGWGGPAESSALYVTYAQDETKKIPSQTPLHFTTDSDGAVRQALRETNFERKTERQKVVVADL